MGTQHRAAAVAAFATSCFARQERKARRTIAPILDIILECAEGLPAHYAGPARRAEFRRRLRARGYGTAKCFGDGVDGTDTISVLVEPTRKAKSK